MNYDKKLARLVKDVNNPKNYKKILDLLGKAYQAEYQFKDFSKKDIDYICGEILGFYDAVKTSADEKRMINWYNKCYFIVSDKNCVLFETMSLRTAVEFYIRGTVMLLATKVKNAFSLDKFVFAENIENCMYLIRGAGKTARFCNVEWHQLDDLKSAGYEEVLKESY
ncbi:hypothetical protein [Treponema sp. C6A8]|uniref:hypothetical protein n=1 Tax=Treponema sp. C6A8 TaxID=1410609 RepID=UPI0004885EA3|nr:hypothetical protein [Treponema sp. C6A8]